MSFTLELTLLMLHTHLIEAPTYRAYYHVEKVILGFDMCDLMKAEKITGVFFLLIILLRFDRSP